MAIALSIVLFLAVTALITLFGYRRYALPGRLYQNLAQAGPGQTNPALRSPENPDFYTISRAAEIVARQLPPSAHAASALRLKLLAGGYRGQNAVAVLYGLKVMTMVAVTLTIALIGFNSPPLMRLLGIAIGIPAGFRLPDYLLARQIRRRRTRLRKGLPDALDLIVVCAEAGLTIDRAFRNVAEQLANVHPELADEFSLFTAETAAGLRRKDALENLAERTQETEIRKFISVVAQADRFGTSLRTHAEYLRGRRHQDAEEQASKVSVKLIFPIFFFIMPCMLLVTVGPAVIAIAKQLGPMFSGGQ
jgi:tight adherence protein C